MSSMIPWNEDRAAAGLDEEGGRTDPGCCGSRERSFWLSVVPVAALHLGLSAWSIASPDRVVLADRAYARLERARALATSSTDRLELVLQTGWPGDYGLHAILLGLGGLPGLLLVQWAFFAATLVLLYGVSRRIGAPGWAAGTATVAYGLLASNLHQPHTVVTEALFNPCVAGVVVLIEATHRTRELTWTRAISMGVLAATAIALRAVFLPVVPIAALHLVWTRSARVGRVVVVVAIAIAPMLTWGGLQLANGRRVTLGGEGFSLGHNLQGRMTRMASLGGAPVPDLPGEQASLGDYLAYSWQNPAPFIRAMTTDGLMLVVNPGVNHTYGLFLGLFEKSEGTQYWVPLIDREGVASAATELARRGGMRLLWNGFGLISWLTFLALGIWGWAVVWRGPGHDFAVSMMLLVLVLVAGTFASHAIRWSQRSPMEFVLAVFVAAALPSVTRWLRSRLRSPADGGADPRAYSDEEEAKGTARNALRRSGLSLSVHTLPFLVRFF